MKIEEFLKAPRPLVKMMGSMLSPIQPTQMGCRIDFDSIICFSDAFINHECEQHHGPLLIGFTIKFKSDLPGVDGSGLNSQWEVPEEPVEVTKEVYANFYNCGGPYEGPYYIFKKFPEKFIPELQEVVNYYADLWEKIKRQGMK